MRCFSPLLEIELASPLCYPFPWRKTRMDEKDLKELMLRQNGDFQKLHDEHQAYEKRLEDFRIKSFLTDEERVEEKEMKKRKLVLKDRMYQLINEFRKAL